MSRDIERPERIELTKPIFPYLVADESAEPTSYVIISKADHLGYDAERTLFYIPGATFRQRDNRQMGTPITDIILHHSFASDEEGDTSHVADFEVRSMQLVSAYGKQLTFTGWLTETRFYPEGYVDERFEEFNPFAGAVKQDEGHERENYSANYGYPYLAPKVKIEGLQLPLEVEITLVHDIADAHANTQENMESHAKARHDREERARKEAEKKAAEKIQREKEHQEWLKTDEGIADTLDTKLRRLIRALPTQDTLTDSEREEIQLQADTFVLALSDKEKGLLLDEQVGKIWSIKPEQVLRNAYYDRVIHQLKTT
jgi:predicted Holliday junction resolvase-like endonuclease